MEINEALMAASEILKTEANELAGLLGDKAFQGMNYRVEIAVRSEMRRLREVAETLLAQLPDTAEEE